MAKLSAYVEEPLKISVQSALWNQPFVEIYIQTESDSRIHLRLTDKQAREFVKNLKEVLVARSASKGNST